MENNYINYLTKNSFLNATSRYDVKADFKIFDSLEYNLDYLNSSDFTSQFFNNYISSSKFDTGVFFNSIVEFKNHQFSNSIPKQIAKSQTIKNEQNFSQAIKTESKIFEKKILKIISTDCYESGTISNIERFMKTECTPNNLPCIIEAAQQVLRNNLTNEHIVEGILTLLSTKSYEEMQPQGTFMCLSLLSNVNYSIRDKAVQTYEKWNSKKGIIDLKSVKCEIPWLQDYINKVINDLEEFGNE